MNAVNKILGANKRVIGLDILRSVAIILVMYEHAGTYLPKDIFKYLILPRPSIDGVSIFFVLSGFLIGGILLKIIRKSGFTKKDILNFWIRRWLRTIPNYYIVLIILIIVQYAVVKNINGFNYKYFIFSQNLYQPHPSFFAEAWSLSIEEWFYLLFPILTYLLYKILKHKNKSVIIAAIIFLIVPLLLRIIKYSFHIGIYDWDSNFRKTIILRLDSLMYGIIGAYISIFREDFWKKIKKSGLIISLVIILFLIIYSSLNTEDLAFRTIYHFNLESIAVFCVLPYFSKLTSIKCRALSNFFTFISLISYSMYLINLSLIRNIVIPSIIKFLDWHRTSNHFNNVSLIFSQFFLFWFLTIFCSYYLYKYVELPIMKFRDRIKI